MSRLVSSIGRAVVATAFVVPAAAMAQDRPAVNLVTHNEVSIAAPAARIWPHIVDPSLWKMGNRLAHRSGPVGDVGEVFAAVNGESPDKVDYFVTNVELTLHRRRTIKLTGTDGALVGFAVFSLREAGGATVVSYDVFSELPMAPEQARAATPASVREMERSAIASSGARFQQELEKLKLLVEKR